MILNQLGQVAEERGNLTEALELFEFAAATFEHTNDPHYLALTERNIARVREVVEASPDPPETEA